MFSSVSGARLYTKMHQPLPLMAEAAAAAPLAAPLPAAAEAAAPAAAAAGPDSMGFPARRSPARGEYLQHSRATRDLVPVPSVPLPCNGTPMRAAVYITLF